MNTKFQKADLQFDMPVFTGVHGSTNAELEKYFGQTFAAEGKNEDEQFVYVPFRCISATMVGGGTWKATDFSDEKVLKAGTKLLLNKPVYKDHGLWTVDNSIGVVVATKWAAGYTDDEGNKIPAGIDGVFRISKKSQPEMCDKLMSDPPEIQSCSVTVIYKYVPSHTFEDANGNVDEWLFERRIGTMVNNEMVCRKCSEVVDFVEVSTVVMGADPYAKIKKADGQLLNIDRSALVSASSFDKDPALEVYQESGKIFIPNAQSEFSFIHLARFSALTVQTDQETMYKEFLLKATGLAPEALTPDALAQYSIMKASDLQGIQSLADSRKIEVENLKKEVGQLKTEKTGLESEKATLTAAKTTLEAKVQSLEAGEKATIEARREAVVAAFSKASGGKGVEAFKSTLALASKEQLEAFEKEYNIAVMQKFGASCKKCGSTELSYQHSEKPDTGAETNSFHLAEIV